MAAPTVSLFSFRIKWKFVWPIQSVLKVHQTLRWNGTASSIFIPIIVHTAVYTCFMLTCIETYACCRLFFIITLHQVHVLYMLIDCGNQTCISLNMLKVIILVILHSRFINLSMIFCTTISFNISPLLFSEMSIDYFFVHGVVKELWLQGCMLLLQLLIH